MASFSWYNVCACSFALVRCFKLRLGVLRAEKNCGAVERGLVGTFLDCVRADEVGAVT